jgi:hypothetical protein
MELILAGWLRRYVMKNVTRFRAVGLVGALLLLPSFALAGKGGKPNKPGGDNGTPKDIQVSAEFSDSCFVHDRICSDGQGAYVSSRKVKGYSNTVHIYDGYFTMTILMPELLGRRIYFNFDPTPAGQVTCKVWGSTDTFPHTLPDYTYNTLNAQINYVAISTHQEMICLPDSDGNCTGTSWTAIPGRYFDFRSLPVSTPEDPTKGYTLLSIQFQRADADGHYWVMHNNDAPGGEEDWLHSSVGVVEVERMSEDIWIVRPLTLPENWLPYLGPDEALHTVSLGGGRSCRVGHFLMPFELTITRLE